MHSYVIPMYYVLCLSASCSILPFYCVYFIFRNSVKLAIKKITHAAPAKTTRVTHYLVYIFQNIYTLLYFMGSQF